MRQQPNWSTGIFVAVGTLVALAVAGCGGSSDSVEQRDSAQQPDRNQNYAEPEELHAAVIDAGASAETVAREVTQSHTKAGSQLRVGSTTGGRWAQLALVIMRPTGSTIFGRLTSRSYRTAPRPRAVPRVRCPQPVARRGGLRPPLLATPRRAAHLARKR